MPNEKFNATIIECRLLASEGKKGLSSVSLLGAKWTTADGISGSLYLSGPKEAMVKTFSAWPVILTDPEKTAGMKLPVEVSISTVLQQSAGQSVNQMAADAAAAAAKVAATPVPAEGLDGVKAEIDQLSK